VIVTPWGEFRLGDKQAETAWLAAHARRHMQVAQQTGTPGGILDGPVNGDWFYRHWARHVSLATFRGLDLSSPPEGLALPGYWRDQRQLSDWMDLHNRIHLLQDKALDL